MPHASRPSPDPLVVLADTCVQCGRCLPACPTYRHDRNEAESPRGRIALARVWTLGTIEPGPVGDVHLDHCLACRSCEAVCPVGVRYGQLLLETRARQRRRRRPGWRQRAAESLAARPRWLARLLALYRFAWPLLPGGLRALPRPPAAVVLPAAPAATRRIGLFAGCVAGPYEAPARAGLARLCASLSMELVLPPAQTCCGTLHAHAGDRERAARLAGRNRAAFEGVDTVLTLASGCHEAVASALGEPGRTMDALQFLAMHADRLRFRECRERIAVHLPCTQRHVVGSAPALRRLLAAVPGLQVAGLDAGYGCCGAAGTQMLTDPARADSYRRPLLEQLAASGATRLLSANIGCRLHLAGGTPIPVQHPVEFLAELAIQDGCTAPVGGASAPTPLVRGPAAATQGRGSSPSRRRPAPSAVPS